MEFLQLKYFCTAAETESFSETARRYLVPTSNISQSVKRLERELGCELFEHRANRIVLNREGKLFYSRAAEALELLESARASLAHRSHTLCGDVRLSCLNNRRLVTAAIEKFTQEHPNVNFIIQHGPKAMPDFDLLISDTCPYEYREKHLLVDEEILLALRRDHPLADKEPLTTADLAGERFITMTDGNSVRNITLHACREAGFSPNVAVQIDDPFYLRKYVELGLGITFVPSVSWQGLFSHNVVLRRVDRLRRQTYAYLPKRRHTMPAVEAFLAALKEEARR